MFQLSDIPSDLAAFFDWFKRATEATWAQLDPEDENYGWLAGARWLPLTEAEIDATEQAYSLTFHPDHRLFLQTLHAIDRLEPSWREIESEEGYETEDILIPYFYNWQTDETVLRQRLEYPYKTILDDVLDGKQPWLPSWGEQPASKDAVRAVFDAWWATLPHFIPIFSHRFVFTHGDTAPVLSVWGSDTIVYGWNLRHYLLAELTQFVLPSVFNNIITHQVAPDDSAGVEALLGPFRELIETW